MPPVTRLHDGVPAAVVDSLLDWLPTSEFATSMRDASDRTIEVTGPDGGRLAVALLAADVGTLSGAPLLVACAAGGGAEGHGPLDSAVVRAVTAAVVAAGDDVAHLEVAGPARVARPVADGVAARLGGSVELVLGERLMVATEVVHPPVPAGAARRATADDRPLLTAWLQDFAVEALGASPERASQWAGAVDNPAWDIWVWEVGGAPVSMVNHRRTTPVSSRVAPVYTPPDLRGNGYAAALTAVVTEELLASGDPRVTLFTDETNATSNALYARIGYRDVGAEGSWAVRRS